MDELKTALGAICPTEDVPDVQTDGVSRGSRGQAKASGW